MKKKFFLHTLLYTLAPKLPVLASFLIFPIISPFLTLKDFGKYGLVMSYYAIFAIFSNLGQTVVLQNSFFEYKNNFHLVWSRALGVMTAASVLSSFLLAIIFFFLLGQKFDLEFFLVSSMLCIALVCSPIDTIAQFFFTFQERPFPLALRSICNSIVNMVTTYVTIKYFMLGYVGWVIGLAASGLFSVIFYLNTVFIKNRIYPIFFFRRKQWKQYLKIGLPLLPHNLSLYIFNTSDRLLLNFFNVNLSRIGLYSQGYIIGSNGMVLVNGIFSALSRKLQLCFRNKSDQDRQQLRTLFMYVFFGTALVFFNTALWMKEIYVFLFRKQELQDGYFIALLVIMAHIFFPLYSFAVYPLFIAKKTNLVAKISLAAAITNLTFNLVFIPLYNIWATLLSTYFSFTVFGMMGLMIPSVTKELHWLFKRVKWVYVFCVGIGIVLSAVAWYLRDGGLGIKLFTSACTVMIFLLMKRKKYLFK